MVGVINKIGETPLQDPLTLRFWILSKEVMAYYTTLADGLVYVCCLLYFLKYSLKNET